MTGQSATLVMELRSIDSLLADPVVGTDAGETPQKVLDNWSQRRPVVSRALHDGASIAELTQSLVKRYTGWWSLLPVFRGEDYEHQLAELNLGDVLGADILVPTSQPNLNRYQRFVNDKILSPLGIVVAGSAIGGVYSFTSVPEYMPLVALPSVLLAGAFAYGQWIIRQMDTDLIRINAEYLDRKIAEVRS